MTVAWPRRARRVRLADVRARWGRPHDRLRRRDIGAIAEYHRSRAGAAGSASGVLDDRTWDDLDLDVVFAAVDHTESTLGQQVLYHRLRTAPVADHLDPSKRSSIASVATRRCASACNWC